jgi:hypothetical protein
MRQVRFQKDGRGGTVKEVPNTGFCLIRAIPCEGEDPDCEDREEREPINKEKAY